jgi:hypothetical protein
MKPTSDAVRFLDDATVAATVSLIRRDLVLGRGSFSSWEEVTPSDYEAGERLRQLIQDGVVPVPGRATPPAILRALHAHELVFWATEN